MYLRLLAPRMKDPAFKSEDEWRLISNYGSVREVQALTDQILALLGVRIRAGELVVRYSDGLVQKCETRTVHRQTARLPLRTPPGELICLAADGRRAAGQKTLCIRGLPSAACRRRG